ncbi:ABC transporter permease [Streptomyces sp. AV19]|uniref:ABC transporter permease n=1 Tax=Streptomyces sp. AV19 TaxID=2793068 RepID=UPI0018FEA61B|nr:ABC transporter permease [Streptomyces sp. AV19]MBH1935578.1 ABC transporter permease [Streptomyces sp. AV19]
MKEERSVLHPYPTGPTGPAAWLRDLLLGARYAVSGGREGWVRTALTATGVGLGVALLMIAASVPSMMEKRHERGTARSVGVTGEFRNQTEKDAPRGSGTLLYQEVDSDFRDRPITGGLLRPDGPDAPVPPGVERMPRTGEFVVSPALDRLLASDDGRLLRDRFSAYRKIGTIADSGLIGPSELYYYAGSDRVSPATGAKRIDRFGYAEPDIPMDPVLIVLTIMVCVVLLTPVGVFIATSVRFGGERRDRRLAALRLLGADLGMIRRIAAGEALGGSAIGLGVGAVLFLLLRENARDLVIRDVSVFPSDIVPSPALTALILLAVPACAVVVTLFALRGVAIEPLGVVRNAVPRRRRLWWRLLVPAAGVGLLFPMTGRTPEMYGDPLTTYRVAAGAVLLLIGVTALLPWLVEVCVARFRGGPLPWQLAVRRLQLHSGPAARAVSGVAVAVAGAIAVQMLFAGVRGNYEKEPEDIPSHSQLQASYTLKSASEAHGYAQRVRATEGVRAAVGYADSYIEKEGDPDKVSSVTVADCASLRELAELGSCEDGDVFLGRSDADNHQKSFVPGTRIVVTPYDTAEKKSHTYRWTIPSSARTVRTHADPAGEHHDGLLVTPSVLDAGAIPNIRTRLTIKTAPGDPDAIERVRNTLAHVDPAVRVWRLGGVQKDENYAVIERGLLTGAVGTLALIGTTMLVASLEQLRERRRLLAVLVAYGTRRRTLAWSVFWQTTVPVLLGMAVAVGGGLALGWTMLEVVNGHVKDWWSFWPMVGAGAGVILAVTVASLPPLVRMMRPEGLRTE